MNINNLVSSMTKYSSPFYADNKTSPVTYDISNCVNFNASYSNTQQASSQSKGNSKRKNFSKHLSVDVTMDKTIIATENSLIRSDKKRKTKSKLSDFNIYELDSNQEMTTYLKFLAKLYAEGRLKIIDGIPIESDSSSYPITPTLIRPMRRRASTDAKISNYCQACHAVESPEWRRGQNGKGSLCNACGIDYAKKKKEESKISHTNTTEKIKVSNLLN